jgi:tRNA(His) 5'-end guanylyltransferase
MSGKDDIGDRMKTYEVIETERRFDPSLPVYARLDGRSFSNFTRLMERPFDMAMHEAMMSTAKALIEKTHARIGYTQSDEISLVWQAENEASQIFFDGKIMKMASVLASLASVHFFKSIYDSERLSDHADLMPHFDCRVIQLPSRTEAANMFLWRELDATKNAVSMAARAYFSAKVLSFKNSTEMRAMLAENGIDFDAYPASFRHGTFLRRIAIEREMTTEELSRIPEVHRPKSGQLVARSAVVKIKMPPFRFVTNREQVIFDGAEPSGTDTL